jgi:hypothetical protein
MLDNISHPVEMTVEEKLTMAENAEAVAFKKTMASIAAEAEHEVEQLMDDTNDDGHGGVGGGSCSVESKKDI